MSFTAYEDLRISNMVVVAFVKAKMDWHLASLLLDTIVVEPEFVFRSRGKLNIRRYPTPEKILCIRTEAVQRGTVLDTGIFPNACNMNISTSRQNLSAKLSRHSISMTGVRNEDHAREGVRVIFDLMREADRRLALGAEYPDHFYRLQREIAELALGPIKCFDVPLAKKKKGKPYHTLELQLYSVKRVYPTELSYPDEIHDLVVLMTNMTDTTMPYDCDFSYAFIDSLMDINHETALYEGDLEVESLNVATVMIDYPLGFRVNLNELYGYLRAREPDMTVIYDQGFGNTLTINVPFEKPEALKTATKKGKIPKHTISITRGGCVKQTGIGLLIGDMYTRFREIIERCRPLVELPAIIACLETKQTSLP